MLIFGIPLSNSPYIAGLSALPPPSSLTCVSLLTGPYQGHLLGTSVAPDPTSTTNVLAPGITTWPSISVAPSTSLPMVNPAQVYHQQTAGLVISPAAAPFPKKLVDKVKSGQFVEMKELLVDNTALMRQLEAMHGTSNLPQFGANRPQLREVSSLTTWCYCFLGYMAIHTADPTTRDQLAYARLIIREAQRHGGKGWLDYDRSFRQQAAIDPLTRWNTLSPGLLASTVLCQRAQRGTQFCTLCREVDHTMLQCALYYCYSPNTCSAPPTPMVRSRRDNICTSWNQGACIYPGSCSFTHICTICHLLHRAQDCPQRASSTNATPFRQRTYPAPPWHHVVGHYCAIHQL